MGIQHHHQKGNIEIHCTLVSLLLLACGHVSAFEVVKPECPPPPSNCTTAIPALWRNDYIIFSVNGILVDVLLVGIEEVVYSCYEAAVAVDDESFPKFVQAVQFESIKLDNCVPPKGSYTASLDALNITGFHNLTFKFEICDKTKSFIDPHNFIGLRHLQSLKVTCDIFNLNYFDFSILTPLEDLKCLELVEVIVPSFPLWNSLHSVAITDGAPLMKLQPWGGCVELEKLVVINWKVTELPEGWLANCTSLNSLQLEELSTLSYLPQKMVNSSSLRSLKLIKCGLDNLPNDLLDNTKNLRVLDLSYNNLESLNGSMFSLIPQLETLVLKNNMLMVYSIPDIAPLVVLHSLVLDHNFHDDTCELTTKYDVTNPWPHLPAIERLSLQSSDVTSLCAVWSTSMPNLKHLNLAKNHIRKLQYRDIEMIRSNSWEVDLQHGVLEAIEYNMMDYEAVLQNSTLSSSNATIRINRHPRECDCRWYWFARVVQERPGYVLLPDLQCIQHREEPADPEPLERMSPESFICEIDCEPSCKCYVRGHDNTTQANCTRAQLDHVPRLPLLRDIHLAYNHIETLHSSDIPDTLEYMDLQYNLLSTVDVETTTRMFSRPTTQYRLKGNRIKCLCNNSALINALKTHQNQVLDYENVTCAHGVPINDVSTTILCLEEHAAVIAGALGFISFLSLIVFALYYRYQREVNIILYAWGWCACCVNEEELDKDKTYDVFISFAYDDSSFVMDELLPGLEKKPHAFAVCVHYRDWNAGDWIPAQIAHSVEESRRTIIVLSRNFLASIWALLEFRTAHIQALKDGRVRLIVVLLEDVVNDERMDDEMRAYLATNTYIKWGDPKFWDKLRYALPHRRRNEKQMRKAGEAVVRLVKPSDPPIIVRDGIALEMMHIDPADNIEMQVEE